MSIFRGRDDGGVVVTLPDDIRDLVCGLATQLTTSLDDDSAPLYGQLTRPIAPGFDHDDPLMVMMRHDGIEANAQLLIATAYEDVLEANEAEAWFATIQVVLSSLASSLALTSEDRLDAAPPATKELISLLQFLLAELVYALEAGDPLGLG